jgi:uncharacterized UBP type Zn finger protein
MTEFMKYLKQKLGDDEQSERMPVSQELYTMGLGKPLVLKDLSASNAKRTFRISKLVRAMSGHGQKHLFSFQQQDAHEFYQHLSNLVTSENWSDYQSNLFYTSLDDNEDGVLYFFSGRRVRNSVPQKVRNPFTGLLASKVSCTVCKYQVIVIYSDGLEA